MGSSSLPPAVRPHYRQINESLYELFAPPAGETPTVEIIFFHGLHLGPPEDAFWETWTRGNECWPQTWLPEEENFPKGRILFVAYDASVSESAKGSPLDIHTLGENLVGDVISSSYANVGQTEQCPVFLVAHSLGGLVVKQMILEAQKQADRSDSNSRIQRFLGNLAGIFYFSTPHIGADIKNFTKYFTRQTRLTSTLSLLSAHAARLNEDFRKWRTDHRVKAYAVGERDKTSVGGYYSLVVSEASARQDADAFTLSSGDHFTVCAPESPRISSALHTLTSFIKETMLEKLQGHVTVVPLISDLGFASLPFVLDAKFVLLQKCFSSIKVALEAERQPAVFILYGGPGTGKSCMAKYVALYYQEKKSQFLDGVFFLDCGLEAQSISKHRELLHILTGEEQQFTLESTLHQNLWKFLSSKSLLIVLDNVQESNFLHNLLVLPQGIKYLITSQNRRIWEDAVQIKMERPSWSEADKILSNYVGGLQFGEFPQHLQENVDAIIQEWDFNPSILANLGMLMKYTNVLDPGEWEVANKDLMDFIDKDDPHESPVLFGKIYHRTVPSISVIRDVDSLAPQHQLLLYLMALCEGPSVPELVLQIFLIKIGGHPTTLRECRRRGRLPSFIHMEYTKIPWKLGSPKTWCTWSMESLPKYIIKAKRKAEVDECVNSLATAFCSTDSFLSKMDSVDTELVAVLCVEYGNEEVRARAVRTMGFSTGTTSQVKSLLRPFIWKLLSKIEEKGPGSRLSACEVFVQYIKDENLGDDASVDMMEMGTESLLSFLPGALSGCMEVIEMEESIVLQEKAARCMIDLARRQGHNEKTISSPDMLDGCVRLLISDLSLVVHVAIMEWLAILAGSTDNSVKIGSNASALLAMVKLLGKDDNPMLQQKAICCLQLLAGNDNNKEKIASIPNSLEGLVRLLATKVTPAVQEQALLCLGSLAENSKNQVKLASIPDALEALVTLLVEDMGPRVQELAARCLGLIAVNVDNKVKIASIPNTLEALVKLLGKDASPGVQEQAVGCLGILSQNSENKVSLASVPNALEALVMLLGQDWSPKVQGRAAECLKFLAVNVDNKVKITSIPNTLEALVRLLATNMIPRVQEQALGCLGSLAEHPENQVKFASIPYALQALVTLLVEDMSPRVQELAARCLGLVAIEGDKVKVASVPKALEALVKLLAKDMSPAVQEQAVWCLGILSQNGRNRVTLASTAGALDAVVMLLAAGIAPVVQQRAAECLNFLAVNVDNKVRISFIPKALEALVKLLATVVNPGVQEQAVGCLGSLAEHPENQVKLASIPYALEALVTLLVEDMSPRVQELAARCLGLIAINADNKLKVASIPNAFEALVKLLRKVASQGLQGQAVWCLGILSENTKNKMTLASIPDALEALVMLLGQDWSPEVQGRAAECLKFLAVNVDNKVKITSIPNTLEALVRLLATNVNPGVQEQAVGCLGSLAEHPENQVKLASIPHALEALVTLLVEDMSPRVQELAARCLGLIAINADNKVKIVAMPNAREALVKLLANHPSPGLQGQAAWCLGILGMR